jgi:hypothetical protein
MSQTPRIDDADEKRPPSFATDARAELADRRALPDLGPLRCLADDAVETGVRFRERDLRRAYDELASRFPPTPYNGNPKGRRDGWALQGIEGEVDEIHGRRYRTYGTETEFATPTPALAGYFAEMLEALSSALGPIYRARIIRLRGHRIIPRHHDGHDGTRFFRYHVPIVANENCLFDANGHWFVMKKKGALYRFRAWKKHAVANLSGERVHLMFSAYR